MSKLWFLLLLAMASPTPAAVTDGLVAHFTFDETSGTTAADSVRGAAGTAQLRNFGPSPWVASPLGGAIALDGIQNWISTAVPLQNNIKAFSFSGWVWADQAPAWASIAKNWGNAATGQFHFGLDGASGQMSNYLSNVVVVKENATFPLGSWQHVAITYDGSTHRIFRNGVEVASAPMDPVLTQNSDVLAFGVKTNDSGTAPDSGAPGWWQGKFDDFGLWNRALTADEVASIYQGGLAGRDLAQSGLPAISSFTAAPPNVATGGSTTLTWSVANSTTLTLTGGPFAAQDVQGLTTISTGPLTGDTNFVLQATNDAGTTTAQVLVGVGAGVLPPKISEFLAENDTGLRDEDGDAEDWIEIYNPNATYSLDLTGYHLTDKADTLNKWTFPSVLLPPHGYLIVFCSEKTHPLHANFQLSSEGEYLALVKPDGSTILQEFAPTYPPQVPDLSYGEGGYLATPTPGADNTPLSGPFLSEVTENPPPPGDNDNLEIVARATAQPTTTVASVTLYYRVMYSAEVALPMVLGADSRYHATIPATASTVGQMLRWRIAATDSAARKSRWPLFRDPANAPEYLGTVVQNPAVTSALPILQRFVQNTGAIDTATGTRCSVFFNGEFFDNLAIRIRGFTSRNWPKKSHKIEMNSGHKFRFAADVPRVTEFDLNTTYTDKSYVRSILTSDFERAIGLPTPQIFALQIRQNATFYSVALFTENPDGDLLRRFQLDPDGAYYKAPTNNTWDTADTFEKKSRLYEAGSADLATFITKLTQPEPALETTVFDEVDVPGMINYMAAVCLTQNIDASDKNHFAYRDTNGNGEWRMLPWDLDLTFGPDSLNTDTIVYNENYASHPYIGASPYLLSFGKYNRFLEAIVNTPRTQQMLNRRIRTLSDQYLAAGWFQNRINQLVPPLAPDVPLDKAKWGVNAFYGGNTYTLQQATDRIKNEYLTRRLSYLNSGGSVGLPSTQVAAPPLAFGTIEANPSSGNQDEEYLEVHNPGINSVDLSNWLIEGQVTYNFKPGTVLLAGESLFLSPKVTAFRARASSPTGGERHFVQGDYHGQLSARGGTLLLHAGGATDPVVASASYPDTSSAIVQSLRITEVNFAPPDGGAFAAGLYEFIELHNLSAATLDLSGVHLTGGVDFDFTGSAIPTLAPGAYVLVVRQIDAFTARYGTGLPIAGTFTGSLDNKGDRIHLTDAVGESVVDFTYQPSWQPATDGRGATLTIGNENQNYLQWGLASGWKASGKLYGTPGGPDLTGDADGDGLPDLWEEEHGLSPTSPADAQQDADHDGISNLAEYLTGTNPLDPGSRFHIESIVRDAANHLELKFAAVAGLTYAIQRAPTIQGPWTTVQIPPVLTTPAILTFTETVKDSAGFYRVVTPAP